MVLIKKSNGKWRICIDYFNLNKVLNFLYAYSGYNQIKIYLLDADKMTFMTDEPTYYYQVIPFSLKNAWATYQRLMDKVFAKHIGHNLEVYVDDMVVK
ncbi:hypothetical protein CR513_34499, partial [Mucuna pruriens]